MIQFARLNSAVLLYFHPKVKFEVSGCGEWSEPESENFADIDWAIVSNVLFNLISAGVAFDISSRFPLSLSSRNMM